MVTTGLMNKQVAAELGVTEITTKVHRGNVMRKMGIRGCCLFVRAPSSVLGNDVYSPQSHRPTGRGYKHVPKYP